MRGDGGIAATAGGAAGHDGERRGRPPLIDYRTVVRIIGEMQKDGEVRTWLGLGLGFGLGLGLGTGLGLGLGLGLG